MLTRKAGHQYVAPGIRAVAFRNLRGGGVSRLVGFALQRDRAFASISAVVLIVLLISSVPGKVE